MIDATDREIINSLQGGFPLSEEPFAEAAAGLGLDEADLIARIERLLADGILSRFGPLYNAEKLGGAVTLAAMRIPEAAFDRVAEVVNAFDEVAHNYRRDHAFNMWFVVATEAPERIGQVLAEIEAATGHPVFNMPKEREFFIGLRLEA